MKKEAVKRIKNPDPYLTVSEAAEFYHVSIDVIYDRIRRKRLESIRIGRHYRIRQSALEAWVTEEAANAS